MNFILDYLELLLENYLSEEDLGTLLKRDTQSSRDEAAIYNRR